MQKDDRWAGPLCCIPDVDAVVFDVSLIGWCRQGWCAVRGEFFEVVVAKFHIDLPIRTCHFEGSQSPLISRRRWGVIPIGQLVQYLLRTGDKSRTTTMARLKGSAFSANRGLGA